MHLKEIKTTTRLLISAGVAILFLLVYSVSTSPISMYYGHDSAFFILVGQGMTEGLLPYRDFFDMKGPYLFFLEYIGQVICAGRTGAFIVQCVNLWLCLCIIDKIYHREKKIMTIKAWLKDYLVYILPCLYVFCYTMERGNLTEEFSLPILLIAVYLVLGYLKKSDEDPDVVHPLKHGLYYGFAFGVLALIRITNAAFIGAILVTVSLDLLLRKKFWNLCLNAIMFVFGCMLAFAPMCLYYEYHGLLQSMISQVFLFGVRYSLEHSLISKTINFISNQYCVLITMSFPTVVAVLFRIKNWKYWILSVASYLLLVLASAMGNGYAHYLTLGIPHLVLGFAMLKEFRTKKMIRNSSMIILVLVFLVMGKQVFQSTLSCGTEILNPRMSLEGRQQILQIKDAIPENEQDNVFLFGVPHSSQWYLQANLLPCNRYCDWQEHYIALNPQIGDEIAQWMIKDPPKWIVVATEIPVFYGDIADIIKSHYYFYTKNETYTLYTLTG